MSAMRLEPLGAGGLPRGQGRWEHHYGTALNSMTQVLTHLSFTQKSQ